MDGLPKNGEDSCCKFLFTCNGNNALHALVLGGLHRLLPTANNSTSEAILFLKQTHFPNLAASTSTADLNTTRQIEITVFVLDAMREEHKDLRGLRTACTQFANRFIQKNDESVKHPLAVPD